MQAANANAAAAGESDTWNDHKPWITSLIDTMSGQEGSPTADWFELQQPVNAKKQLTMPAANLDRADLLRVQASDFISHLAVAYVSEPQGAVKATRAGNAQ